MNDGAAGTAASNRPMHPAPVRQPAPVPDAASDAELLSALIDGELDAAAARELIGRICREAALHERWTWLHVAQEALRAHEVAALALRPAARRVAQRVSQALDQQPALAPRRRPVLARPWPQWSRHALQGLVAGAAASAAAAGVALVVFPLLHPGGAERGVLVAAPAPVPAIVPVTARAAAAPAGATRVLRAQSDDLNYYLAAHRELADIGLMPRAAPLLRAALAEDR